MLEVHVVSLLGLIQKKVTFSLSPLLCCWSSFEIGGPFQGSLEEWTGR